MTKKSEAAAIIKELQGLGSESIKKVLSKHGAKEPFYGVKVEELKKFQKRIKVDYELALELYKSGISDAMYLAGLISDPPKMTKADLQQWADGAYWYMLSEYTVAWTAAESKYGEELALQWIEAGKENLVSAGWCTLSSIVAIKADAALDLSLYKKLLHRVEKELQKAPNRARYVMNGFVIAVGTYVAALTDEAIRVAEKVGQVSVEMGGTACKVPAAAAYIQNSLDMGRIGKKRKMAKC
jgi:3-methyladenine DNA glycosylase AlkD